MIISPFVHIFDIISLFAAEFEEPKIGISGKGLKSLEQKMCLQSAHKVFLQFDILT